MFNQITLVGRLGKDPELDYTTTGTARTRFSLAVDRMKKDEVDWFYITAFGKTAEFASQYLTKGRLVLITGRMESYRKDPESPMLWGVVAERIRFMDKAPEAQPTAETANVGA